MNLSGIYMGLFTFLAIGLGFLWVIKLEYYVGAHVAKLVGIVGVLVSGASLLVPSFYLSAVIGIVGGTIFWGATELPDQEKRVAAGMFKANPKRQARTNGDRK